MPTLEELKKEVNELEREKKEKYEINELNSKKERLLNELYPKPQPKVSGFKRVLQAIGNAETRRLEIESKQPKIQRKQISFEDIGFQSNKF